MEPILRRIADDQLESGDRHRWLIREWLVTNGLGGYASGTVSGVPTRRYHGMLIAAHPAPLGRWLQLAHISERLRLSDGTIVGLSGERPRDDGPPESQYLREFRLENGLPHWQFQVGDVVVEKRLVLPHEQNTVYVQYRLVAGDGPLRLKLLPFVHSRSHDASVDAPLPGEVALAEYDACYEVLISGLPTLRMTMPGVRHAFTVERQWMHGMSYFVEAARGYEATGSWWSPGYFRVDLSPGVAVTLVASTESWDVVQAIPPDEAFALEHIRRSRLVSAAPAAAHTGLGAELVLAADQFIIRPVGRTEDAARAHAEGDEVRSVIAGYHWFTDWGRDTMISLEGLTLSTGRHVEAGYMLRTFAHYIRDGLLPNLFPEGQKEGLYHTADATMWFFHAIDRYLDVTGDWGILDLLLPKLVDVAEHHERGTHFGIGVDPHDGLLRQGAPGYQLTWMDAKVGDWVVTPRRGKAVEINALWYNAQQLLAGWLERAGRTEEANTWSRRAARTHQSFNERFWNSQTESLFDVVDGERGDDPACRPNQVIAISPRHAALDPSRWASVVRVVQEQLYTPFGLRTLSPRHPDYQPKYDGDLRARDAAYHQGTVWPWLMGPFIDAWLKVHPGQFALARKLIASMQQHLNQACIGSISEIFDAEPPHTPRGCIAQAWSVAEMLRLWLKTATPPENQIRHPE